MPADLGILLVHGIGSQKRGETIANMGEPLYRALKNWIKAGKVEIVDAVLRPKDRSEPAHVRTQGLHRPG